MENCNFVIWGREIVDNAAFLKGISGIADRWELDEGIPRAENFGDEATLRMDLDRPYDTVLMDSIPNSHRLVVVSAELAEFLKAKNLEKIEYLPVRIIDHKGKKVSDPFYIVHPIDFVDCLDTEKCGAVWSQIDETAIQRVERLVFHNDLVDASSGSLIIDRRIFRPLGFGDVTFVSRGLARSIEQSGFTGIRWVEIEDYPRPGSGRQ